jgi:dipeptidyl-peptidase-4
MLIKVESGIFDGLMVVLWLLKLYLKGNDVFKMAIAVAPVTNWRFYDSIYTERYMQTSRKC